MSVNTVEQYLEQLSNKLSKKVAEKYTLDDFEADLYFEDAGLENVEQAHEVITGLFIWRHIMDIYSLVELMNKMDGKTEEITPQTVFSFMLKTNQDFINDGTYKDWDEAIDSDVKMAMTYRCYEPWDVIVKNLINNETSISEEVAVKTVSFLYDGYAVEEENA